MQSGQRSKSCLSNNSKTTEANLRKLHRKIEHNEKVCRAQELGSYAQSQGSLAVFKVTARDQGHYKGHSGAFVTYCNISCLLLSFEEYKARCFMGILCLAEDSHEISSLIFSEKKKNEKICKTVVCCSRDWGFKG